MDAVRKDVESLVQKELDSANEKFPMFRSGHEGYAVILEEIEEAKAELIKAEDRLKSIWLAIKNDYSQEMLLPSFFAKSLKQDAINLAIEAIQVAAMAQKLMDSLGGGMESEDI